MLCEKALAAKCSTGNTILVDDGYVQVSVVTSGNISRVVGLNKLDLLLLSVKEVSI
jgi:pyruvate kinase